MQITYAEILKSARERNGSAVKDMYDVIKNSGIACSQRSFYNYYNGSQVPDVIKGRAILNELDIAFDDKLFNELIEYSINNKSNLSSNSNYTTSISIALNKLIENVDNKDDAKLILDERIEQTSNNFSDYISQLIRRDLKDNILPIKERK